MIQFAVTEANSFSGELFDHGRTIRLASGEVLHDVYDNCTELGMVVSGKLRLSRLLSSGCEIILKEFGPHEIYAELIVFTGEKYPGWLIAAEDSVVIEVEYSHVLKQLEDKESLLSFITGISQKMTHLTNKIEIMSLKTVQQKIAYCLLADGEMPLLSVSRTADYLGCSRESLSRAYSELEKNDSIVRENGGVKILNRKQLEDLF